MIKEYIYESPDEGETIYRRVCGDYDNKEIYDKKNDRWIRIQ